MVSVFGAMLGTPADTDQLLGDLVALVGADPDSAVREHRPWRERGGAYNRVPAGGTAFVHRDARFLLKHAVVIDPEPPGAEREATRECHHRHTGALAGHPEGNPTSGGDDGQPEGGVMRLTKFGHSCLLVEEGGASVLLDPGMLSGGFEELEGLTAVLFTHQHVDHLDQERLHGILDRNPGARVISDEGSAEALGKAGADVEVVHDGDQLQIGGLGVRVVGRDHAVIHPDIPVVPNVGFLVGGRLFHPGDAFTLPGQPIEVLAVPAGAPWLKISESIDYLREVRPGVAVPVHEKVLSTIGVSLHYRQLEELGTGGGTTLHVLDDGKPVEL